MRSATTRSVKTPEKYIKTSIWHCLEVHQIVGMWIDDLDVLRGYISSESTKINRVQKCPHETLVTYKFMIT